MKIQAQFAMMGLLALAGCATPYVPPKSAPPPLWLGASGFAPDGPPRTSPGVKRAGDTFATVPLRFRRTGVLTQTIVAKSAFGGEITIPAGSKAFATNWSLMQGTTYTPMRNVQTELDPVEWCVVALAGFAGKADGSQTACFFYETPERARLVQDYSKGGFAYATMLEFSGAAGMPSAIPRIEEGAVAFDPIDQELRVQAVEKKGVRIATVLSGGKNTRVNASRLLRWAENGEAALGGAFRFRKVPSDPAAVDVQATGQIAPAALEAVGR